MKWVGPHTIDNILNDALEGELRPPEDKGVYLVSMDKWEKEPATECIALYVGSNTGKSGRFRTRIGDLIADLFGFFSKETGHHSGGQSLYDHCKKNQINPKSLYIGWLEECKCERCEENELYDTLKPLLNKKRPSICTVHQ
jgi:hypothetical protein